jgi:prophage antirepressor-like protein
MNFLTSSDLDTSFDEPRIQDLRLAQGLGFARPRVLRELIERNSAEIQRYGLTPRRTAKPKGGIGRPTDSYFLNEPQALLVCMFSNTPRAADVRQQLITVFMAWRRSQCLVPVRAHERRQSTSTEVALRLKTNVDRLEKILRAHERAAALDTVLQMARDVHAQHERVMQDTARTVEAMGVIARG